MVTIIRYPNRRLYLQSRGYITHADLVRMLMEGERVEVRQRFPANLNKPEKTVTREVLLACLPEFAPQLSVDTLVEILKGSPVKCA